MTRYHTEGGGWTGFAKLGTREFEMCSTFDNAIDSARRRLVSGEFRECWKWVQAAASSLALHQLAATSQKLIQTAKEDYGSLLQLVGQGPAHAFPTIESVRRLLVKAEELFQAGEYRQARFVALMCSRESERLLAARTGDSDVVWMFVQKMVKIQALYNKLAANMPLDSINDLVSSVLGLIEVLISQCRLILAERLLEDLDVAITPQTIFLDELERES